MQTQPRPQSSKAREKCPGDEVAANNHRPITVLPTISKILEKAVHTQMYGHLRNNEIITSKQFGSRPKLSTETALAHFTDNILQNMDTVSLKGAVFLDLSKAFDTVDHYLLLQKLTNIGLTFATTQWFRSYLTNKSEITSVGNAHSAPTECLSVYPRAAYWDLYCFRSM